MRVMPEGLEANDRSVSPLARVSRSFLGRRWPEFFVELVLIIMGILGALAIDGWIQDRRDLETERSYMTMLQNDLVQIQESLQRYVDFETANMHQAAAAYSAIAVQNLPGDAAALQQLIGGLSARRTLRIVSGAFTDLTSTGSLQLIRRQELREKILQFFAESERVETVVEKNNTAFIDELYYRFLMDVGITALQGASTDADRRHRR